MRFEPTPFDNAEWRTDTLPTELIRSVLSDGIFFLYHFNDQLGEAWFCKSTRIDEITSIQRALNILKRALSRCQLSSKCLV